MALLVDYYRELPQPEAEDIGSPEWTKRWQGSLETFRKMVKVRYSEGTLQRLLCSQNPEARRAAVLALGQVGTMRSNPFLADKLRNWPPTPCGLCGFGRIPWPTTRSFSGCFDWMIPLKPWPA
jgi:hypothetical protein